MKQSLFFLATVSLTAGLSIGCYAQERATADTTKISREEWQARVNASRERLDLRRQELMRERNKQIDPRREELTRERNKRIDRMRREFKSMVAPLPTSDEIAEIRFQTGSRRYSSPRRHCIDPTWSISISRVAGSRAKT